VFNYTFLYILREYHCVFIGMSMQDQNVRRLLHYSVAERRGATDADPRRTGLRHYALLPRSGSSRTDKHNDLALRLLGTRALWLESFDEIRSRLEQVYGQSAWQAVY
jgi:SIR2-like domain